MLNKLTILFFLCLCSLHSFADSTTVTALKKWEIGSRAGIGHIWAHVSKVNYLKTSHLYNQEFIIARVPNGEKSWHHDYNYTKYGVLFAFVDFGNSEVGKGFSLIPFYDFSLLRKEKSWLTFRLGIGLGYLTQKWDRVTNYKNIIIGSNLNASFDCSLNYDYAIAKKWVLSSGVAFGHFSNAKFSAPNSGINYPKVLFGLKYRNFGHNRDDAAVSERTKIAEFRRFGFFVNYNVGLKENTTVDNNKYFTSNLNSMFTYQSTIKSVWGLGVEFIHDSGKIRSAKALNGLYKANLLSYTAIGIAPSYQFVVNRSRLLFQFGYYLNNKAIMGENFYNRLALRQYISESLQFHIGIRNHKVNAQTLELGIVYQVK